LDPARRAAILRRAAGLLIPMAAAAAACGKEGPPLPPLRPEPGHIREVSATRDGDRIELRMQVPAANFDGTTPPVIERVEIYMQQTAAGAPPPGVTDLFTSKHLVRIIPIRPPDDPADAPAKPPAAPAKPPAAVVAGEIAIHTDVIDRAAVDAAKAATRYYLVVGATGRSRRGRPSPILPVPLSSDPAPPTDITTKYDQTTMTLAWTGAAGQQFRVYEASGPGAGASVTELTTEPVPTPEFSLPVWFATERCFAVRAIATEARVSVAGPIGPGVCATPVDTFAPPAPTGLNAFQEDASGGIVLRWTAADAPDLAGYLVLRGEGTGEKLQQLVKAPIAETTYVDKTITPGTTYVYVVVALDRAGNPSGQSNRQQLTARLPPAFPRSRVHGPDVRAAHHLAMRMD
jgi:hypothetical protein